ncbi:MAG: FtsH protease activity modulator HflK [Candidatus Polarisedimenticolaceae bacterium]|nr:FtsH protease activity modulator HflK [Candidatus Polarisedimenticolaceae bacterium]
MTWNEPGGGNKGDRDPWSGKGKGGQNQGPPDLDEVVKKLQEKLGSLLGGGGNSSSGGKPGDASGGGMPPGGSKVIAVVVIAAIGIVLLMNSFYKIEAAERGVVLRFGAYNQITDPGLNLKLPFIDEVYKVNIDQISSFNHKAQMLTKDENIIDVELTVQSKIQDPADYLFQDRNPQKTIQDATETAVRETIGKSGLDFILTEGRSSIAADIKERAQRLIDLYKTGLKITSINMQPAKPPEQVKSAFDDAIKAREDKERLENEAHAYANQIVPQARGAAARQVEAARAYEEKVIAEAEGESSRFLAVLTEYEKAPEVTRERLYLETVEEVLSRTSKVMLDVKSGNSLMYLPLDKLIKSAGTSTTDPDAPQMTTDYGLSAPLQQQPADTRMRDVNRGRRVR